MNEKKRIWIKSMLSSCRCAIVAVVRMNWIWWAGTRTWFLISMTVCWLIACVRWLFQRNNGTKEKNYLISEWPRALCVCLTNGLSVLGKLTQYACRARSVNFSGISIFFFVVPSMCVCSSDIRLHVQAASAAAPPPMWVCVRVWVCVWVVNFCCQMYLCAREC